jgi:hypothetical protein
MGKELSMLKITVLLTLFVTILLIRVAVAPRTGVAAPYHVASGDKLLESPLFRLDQDQTYQADNLASTLACPLDMISYWKLDEITGSTFVDFVGTNDGQCAGSTCPFPEEGILNGGQRFMGSQEIDVPTSTDFDWHSSSDFSIELWVNIPQTTTCAGRVVFIGRHAGTPAWWVGCAHGSNVAAFSLRDSAGIPQMISGGPVLNDGEWHHIVAIHDGGHNLIKLFVDGQLAASEVTMFTGGWTSQKEVNIGYYNVEVGHTQYHFAGILDEIAVYGRTLSAEEIADHYESVPGGENYCKPAALVINLVGPGSVNAIPVEPYISGQEVTLTAEPDAGFIFFEWSGDLTGSVNPTTITMNGNKEITATFSAPVYYTLAVNANGLGMVKREPDLNEYLHGTLVTLTAVPQPAWLFSFWDGDLTGKQNPVELLVTTDLVITANFIEADYQIFLPLIRK